MNSHAVTLAVDHVAALSPTVFRVGLKPTRERVPRYEAGQYLKVVMPDGSLRPLSIASPPESDHIELQVQRRSDAMAGRTLVDHLRQSATVDCHMPYGRCRLPPDQRPVMMIAGGTGIAPMRAMLASSIARAETRRIELYWGVATPDALFLDAELRALSSAHPRVHYHPVIEHAPSHWRGAVGFPHALALREHPCLAGWSIFCSGSPGMSRAVVAALQAHGVHRDQFFCDWLDILHERNDSS
ncbi:MAG: hypothetical protein BGP24_09870 [Lysobacterales bacterium 69-70]|nr:hypothetical protein [Xanthomonadaceae bacterium]ODU33253.1 MAG: hypothetical protein ABS97_12895 [Xanthomonadaceae bacterium SCN 69-320]ODV20421.1 MAG: hypothetical protein ABT27_06775 [Xanthomonadaceae bacterium SCN 69-25]OJZ00796.1 MAG: hypothetical protein BGP24_09870 [Xanthomonadales bacterium 69-70]